jgi:hypothetical protein
LVSAELAQQQMLWFASQQISSPRTEKNSTLSGYFSTLKKPTTLLGALASSAPCMGAAFVDTWPSLSQISFIDAALLSALLMSPLKSAYKKKVYHRVLY